MDYLIMLIEGISTFISPCLLPVVPIYIAYFVGDNEEDKKRTIINSIGFMIGFSVVFILLAVFASIFGKLVSQYMSTLQIIFGLTMIAFGLQFMEIINIKLLNRTGNIKIDTKNFNFFKAIVFGIFFSITWTPCVGSFLGSALMLVATEGKVLKGIVMLSIYSIGLGIPFILCAVLIDKLKSGFQFIKTHYTVIKYISGILLILMGLYTIIK